MVVWGEVGDASKVKAAITGLKLKDDLKRLSAVVEME